MNNKYILAAVCATAFFGTNLVANPSLLDAATTPHILTTENFNFFIDPKIIQWCKENPTSPLSQTFFETCAAGKKVLDVISDVISNEIKKEINSNSSNLKTLLNEDTHPEQLVETLK